MTYLTININPFFKYTEYINTQDTSTTEITYKNDFVGLIFTFILKSEFPKSVHALHSGLFLSFAFHTNTGGDTQSVKERKSEVDWCNPLYSGTKGSNWNENMSTSKHMHWKTHAHNEHSALFMHIKHEKIFKRLRNKAPVCLCVCLCVVCAL